jgi:hypothetical protein
MKVKQKKETKVSEPKKTRIQNNYATISRNEIAFSKITTRNYHRSK